MKILFRLEIFIIIYVDSVAEPRFLCYKKMFGRNEEWVTVSNKIDFFPCIDFTAAYTYTLIIQQAQTQTTGMMRGWCTAFEVSILGYLGIFST